MRLMDVMLYNYHQLKQSIAEKRAEKKPLAEVRGRHIADPTAGEAISHLTEIESVTLPDGRTIDKPERWLQVVDGAIRLADDIEQEVVRRRYWKKEPYQRTADDMHISQGRYYLALDAVRATMVAGACQYGLLKIM